MVDTNNSRGRMICDVYPHSLGFSDSPLIKYKNMFTYSTPSIRIVIFNNDVM